MIRPRCCDYRRTSSGIFVSVLAPECFRAGIWVFQCWHFSASVNKAKQIQAKAGEYAIIKYKLVDSDEVNADFFYFIWSLLFGLFLCGLVPLGIENHLVWTGMSFGLCPKQIQNTLRALPKVGVSRHLDLHYFISIGHSSQ